jgi:CBS domain-containing protein
MYVLRNACFGGEAAMTTIRQILERKGHDVITIAPDDTVYQALERMAELDIGALVVAADGRPVGLLGERDYAREVILKGRSSLDTPIRDIMVKELPTASPDQTVEACMATMTNKRIRHILVMEDNRLVGLVSIGDLVKAVIDHQQSTIEQLVGYVSGNA